MTNCLHYADYTRDAMKLVVEGMALEELDGISLKVVKGSMWKCGPGPPATLGRQ